MGSNHFVNFGSKAVESANLGIPGNIPHTEVSSVAQKNIAATIENQETEKQKEEIWWTNKYDVRLLRPGTRLKSKEGWYGIVKSVDPSRNVITFNAVPSPYTNTNNLPKAESGSMIWSMANFSESMVVSMEDYDKQFDCTSLYNISVFYGGSSIRVKKYTNLSWEEYTAEYGEVTQNGTTFIQIKLIDKDGNTDFFPPILPQEFKKFTEVYKITRESLEEADKKIIDELKGFLLADANNITSKKEIKELLLNVMKKKSNLPEIIEIINNLETHFIKTK